MSKKVYLDHAAVTPVKGPVLEAMRPYLSQEFGNPSTVYDLGTSTRETLEEQRGHVAGLIGASDPAQIIFTSSGAEANNLAIKGTAFAYPKKGRRIIVSSIEHHSVLNAARFFERLDYEVTFLPVDKYGLVDPERLRKALSLDTVLVSVMHGNNEIGTIEPVKELAGVCHEQDVLFHTDAVATVGNIPVDVKELDVDLLSFSGISLGAPLGTGALYFRKNLRLMPLIHGGIQERGRRAGTENVPAIIGLGKAAEIRKAELDDRIKRLKPLRDALLAGIRERIPRVLFTGHPEKRLPGHASICVEAIEGEALLFMLSHNGIYANTGSACASKALKTSPVLVSIGVPADVAQGSLVFTFDDTNTMDEVDYVLKKLPPVVERLRAMSPIWNEEENRGEQA